MQCNRFYSFIGDDRVINVLDIRSFYPSLSLLPLDNGKFMKTLNLNITFTETDYIRIESLGEFQILVSKIDKVF